MIAWTLNKLKGDKFIWLLIFLISLISLLAVYSSTSALAFKLKSGQTEYYLIKHFLLLGLGFGVMYAIHLFDYRIFAKLSKALLYISIPLLAYTLLFGSNINQAARWINIFGQSFQPSDLGKLALMVFLAKILTEKQGVIKDFQKGFLPVIGWVGLICLLIAPADLSTSAVIFITSVTLMFIAGVDLKYLGILFLIGAVSLVVLFNTVERAETWKQRWKDFVERQDTEVLIANSHKAGNYQPIQSNIAIATGGFFGKGVGKSTQKNFLPQPYSDYVFAIILEEYGMIGGIIVIILYLLLLIRAVGIVTTSRTFGALLAAGLSFLLVIQALINMGVTVGLLPVTGLPLPMLSMGGTSILFTGMSLGIILSVSRGPLDQKKNPALDEVEPAI
ncbi:MAG: FtsW/RodA/SpoVE family cell cycle protein [Bacteroidia bacterium]|nr:FtsW/RodA/SpoVE family cell cycle protein [Bacteroidia bacterium]